MRLGHVKIFVEITYVINGFNLRIRKSYMNPSKTKRIKDFEIFGRTKRIHETNLLKTDESNQNESMDSQNESTFL